MDQKFAPSLMGMDMMNVESQIHGMDGLAAIYHIDLLDWHYAKNLCLSPQFVGQLRKITDTPLDVHIMMDPIDMDLIEELVKVGTDVISMPAELINQNVFKYISYIKEHGKKVGIVLNPATPLDIARYYLDQVDLVTFMGVTPGFGGQKLVPVVLDKIREAHALREEKGYHFETQIDGGCHRDTMKAVYETGVDYIVMGATCLFSHNHDTRLAWDDMLKEFREWVEE